MALIGVDERQLYGFLMYYLTIWDLVSNYLVFQGLLNYRYEYNRYILHTHTHTHCRYKSEYLWFGHNHNIYWLSSFHSYILSEGNFMNLPEKDMCLGAEMSWISLTNTMILNEFQASPQRGDICLVTFHYIPLLKKE